MTIENEDQLRELYGWPKGRAGKKVLSNLEKHSKAFINKSPFLVLSSYDTNGQADASPRGGKVGFVHVLNDSTILIPDSKGNNRVDSLVNIVQTGKIGILFMIPGINETLRINGKASINTDESNLSKFMEEQNPPKTCIVVNIDEVFLHCAKAFMRSKLWVTETHMNREDFPSMGRMLNDQLGTNNPEESQEEMERRYSPDL